MDKRKLNTKLKSLNLDKKRKGIYYINGTAFETYKSALEFELQLVDDDIRTLISENTEDLDILYLLLKNRKILLNDIDYENRPTN